MGFPGALRSVDRPTAAGCAWGVASASQIPKRNLGRQSWSPRPTGATQVVPSEEPMWASAPTKRRESFINHPGQRRTAERLRQRVRGNGWELRQRSSPKGLSTSDNPSVSLRLTAPFAQGSLWDGDADCRVASLLAMTVLNLCHSEEAQRTEVGIRPFLRWTGDGPPYLGHGLRRPNSVPKFGASVKSSAPTEGLPKPQQQAGVGIGPYGKRGKSRWSNAVFARQPQSPARGRGSGSLMEAPPVLTLTLPQLSRTV